MNKGKNDLIQGLGGEEVGGRWSEEVAGTLLWMMKKAV